MGDLSCPDLATTKLVIIESAGRSITARYYPIASRENVCTASQVRPYMKIRCRLNRQIRKFPYKRLCYDLNPGDKGKERSLGVSPPLSDLQSLGQPLREVEIT